MNRSLVRLFAGYRLSRPLSFVNGRCAVYAETSLDSLRAMGSLKYLYFGAWVYTTAFLYYPPTEAWMWAVYLLSPTFFVPMVRLKAKRAATIVRTMDLLEDGKTVEILTYGPLSKCVKVPIAALRVRIYNPEKSVSKLFLVMEAPGFSDTSFFFYQKIEPLQKEVMQCIVAGLSIDIHQ